MMNGSFRNLEGQKPRINDRFKGQRKMSGIFRKDVLVEPFRGNLKRLNNSSVSSPISIVVHEYNLDLWWETLREALEYSVKILNGRMEELTKKLRISFS